MMKVMTKLDYLKQNAYRVDELENKAGTTILIYSFTEQALSQAISILEAFDKNEEERLKLKVNRLIGLAKSCVSYIRDFGDDEMADKVLNDIPDIEAIEKGKP
jgi:hypothetical protein